MSIKENDVKITIDHLPTEILLETFGYLDPADLLNVTLVCKEWNQIISNNLKTMIKLPLRLTKGTDEEAARALNLKRKFSKIILVGLSDLQLQGLSKKTGKISVRRAITSSDNLTNLLQLIQKHGSNIRELHIKDIDVNTKVFYEIILLLPELEYINFHWVKCLNFEAFKRIRLAPVQLEKLKRICLSGPFNFFNIFRAPNIIELEAYHVIELDETFLTNLPHLRKLRIWNCCGKSQLQPLSTCNLSLKKLKLGDVTEVDGLRLLNLFKETIEELDIHVKFNSIFQFALTNLPNLKTLKVDIDYTIRFGSEKEVCRNMRPNMNVTTFSFTGYLITDIDLQQLLDNLPNVQKLFVSFWSYDNHFINCIVNNLKQLEELKIESILRENVENVIFPTLRSLHIHKLSVKSGLELISKNSPNLEKLTIDYICDPLTWTEIEFAKSTQHWNKMQHLKLGGRFIVSCEIFDVLLRDCPELKSVTISKFSKQNDLTMIDKFKQNGIRISVENFRYFEQAEWNVV